MDKIKDLDPTIFHADLPDFYLPPKEDVYTKMEALIYHFKIVMRKLTFLRAKCIILWKVAMGNWVFI